MSSSPDDNTITNETDKISRNKTGMSLIAKIFLGLLILLFVVATGFVISAWLALSRVDDTLKASDTSSASTTVETLKPAGANQAIPVYTPDSQNAAASGTYNTAKPTGNTSPSTPAGTPVLPTNTKQNAAAKPKEILDNLF
ncbi:hypothetical protein [Stenoxybacter acetivorans]|uniref:hypothetical protein n=1 Tax=Stenoxybacter acetivorans TaxID=422441 RepID=UPI0012EBD740|nr:hypothetical protein [Stenoxybacter acetivorans]